MYRDPKQSGLQLVDGVLSGEHLGDERILRASQGPVRIAGTRPARTTDDFPLRSGRQRPGTSIPAPPHPAWRRGAE